VFACGCCPLSSEYGTHKTVKAGFWPWLEPFCMRKSVKIFELPWIWGFGIGHQGLGVRVDHRCGADMALMGQSVVLWLPRRARIEGSQTLVSISLRLLGPVTRVKKKWDSQGQIPALTFTEKSWKQFEVFPIYFEVLPVHSEVFPYSTHFRCSLFARKRLMRVRLRNPS